MNDLKGAPLIGFLLSWPVLLFFLAQVFSAGIGLLGMNHVDPSARDRKLVRYFWLLVLVGFALAALGACGTAVQMRDTDLQQRKDAVAAATLRDQNAEISAKLTAANASLATLQSQNLEISSQLARLADATHASPGSSPSEIVQLVLQRLPKTTVNSVGQVTGNRGIITQGQSGGSNTLNNFGPSHMANHFYNNDNDVGFAEVPIIEGKRLHMKVFHAQEPFPWGQEVDFNDTKVVCQNPDDGKHNFGIMSGAGPTYLKAWDVDCEVRRTAPP